MLLEASHLNNWAREQSILKKNNITYVCEKYFVTVTVDAKIQQVYFEFLD